MDSALGRRSAAISVLLAMLSFSLPVSAGGIDQLRQFFREVKAARGSFQQSVVLRGAPDRPRKVQHAAGQFAFQRPGKLRWEYEKPYRQLLIANGEKLSVYDEDLAQVTVKRLGSALGETPAALLAGESLEAHFTLVDAGEEEGLALVDALPVNREGNFARVRIALRDALPQRMEIEDNFGQKTVLLFGRFMPASRLDGDLFRLRPPPGVDVVGD